MAGGMILVGRAPRVCRPGRLTASRYLAMTHLTLEQHNGPTLQSPSWLAVESALRNVHPRERGYFILSRPGSGYVQAAGARLRMICEWREVRGPDTFRHFVLGHRGKDERWTSINTCVGIVQLQQNEILTLEDVVVVFRRYYDGGTVPEQFVLRDDTARFGQPPTA